MNIFKKVPKKFECPFGYKDKHGNCSQNGMLLDYKYSIGIGPTGIYKCAHMGSFKCKLDSYAQNK